MLVEPAVFWGGAVSLALAALTAFGWLIKLTLMFNREQGQARHAMRNEIAIVIGEVEDRLTRRVERLEEHSYGLRAWARQNGRRNDHE